MSKSGNQTIGCEVTSCAFNDAGRECELEHINVMPRCGCNNGKAEDESACGSYEKRNQ
ncbi:MAG: DUF1540 domain-containing protein [Eubacteriales bacterium]|nr:DUF1540 domain-containing protein [Eubacteriales bacterium]